MYRTLLSAALLIGASAALTLTPSMSAYAQEVPKSDTPQDQDPEPKEVGPCECEATGTESPADALPACVKPGSVKCDISSKKSGVCTKGECPGPAKSCSFVVSMAAESNGASCLWRLHRTKTNADGTTSTGLTASVGKAFSHGGSEPLACKEKLVLKLTADNAKVCTLTLECKDCAGQ